MTPNQLPPLPEPDTHCFDDDTGKDVWSYTADQMHAYALATLAQQEQEPVAWLYVDTVGERYLCFSRPTGGGTITNLYTTPPAPQPAPVDELPDLNPEDVVVDVVLKQLGGFAPVTTHGIRVTHKPSRVSVVVDSEHSQHRNRQLALDALRAITHPQAHPVPAPVGEREAFETWAKQRWLPLDRCEIGGASYRIVETNLAWCAWQARAALQSPAPQTKGQP